MDCGPTHDYVRNWDLRAPAQEAGVTLPRWQWHVVRASTSGVTTVVIKQAFRTSSFKASIAGAAIAGVLPHVLGVWTCQYAFDRADWVADAVISSAPIAVVTGGRGWKWSVVSAGVYAFAYSRVYANARP